MLWNFTNFFMKLLYLQNVRNFLDFLNHHKIIFNKKINFRAKSPTTLPRRSFRWRTRQFGNRNLTKSLTSSRPNRSSSQFNQKSSTKRRLVLRSSKTKLFFLPIKTYQHQTLHLRWIRTIRQPLHFVIQQQLRRMTMQFLRFLSRFDFRSTGTIIFRRKPFTASGHPADSSLSRTENSWIT